MPILEGPMPTAMHVAPLPLLVLVTACHRDNEETPPPTPDTIDPMPDTSTWRGFNLLEKFNKENFNGAFVESDFRWMKSWGFNFVRIPLDYRTYTRTLTTFDQDRLEEIDRAVALGRKYGIHVSLNLHRAPGYCVNPPAESLNLWKDTAAQDAFVAHWSEFARRYRTSTARELSFNLINEPGEISEADYAAVMNRTVAAIHAISPGRPVLIDGLKWASEPCTKCQGNRLIHATRGYAPFAVSHYKASWIANSDTWPVPSWPLTRTLGTYLYCSGKDELQTPVIIEGDFPAGTTFTTHVRQVSHQADVTLTANGTALWSKSFVPGPGSGEWEEVVYAEQWNVYQNIYNKAYSVTLSAPATRFELACGTGDWLTLNHLEIAMSGGPTVTLTPDVPDWGHVQLPVQVSANGTITGQVKEISVAEIFTPWKAWRAAGHTIAVGEWGAYNQTPHAVTLAWMKDWLEVWKANRAGWALWNLRGSFGVVDSERTDVTYTPFEGHQLDQKMLDLLRQYL